MVGNGADKMCRIILIIILHHVTFQESFETAKNECMHRWLVNVLCQKRRKACQETVWERLTIYAVDNFGRCQAVFFDKNLFKLRGHLVFDYFAQHNF